MAPDDGRTPPSSSLAAAMAKVEPLRAQHYDLEKTGGLQDVVAPPYDVIDARQRAELEQRSSYNVVRIDLPVGEGPYEHAARELATWREQGVVVQDERPALWVLEQDYTGPDGRGRTRHGFLARVRVEDYGPGLIRPHERTHPGPKEDRLRLTRATKANLSPIFSLYSDPAGTAWEALEPATSAPPWSRASDEDGTVNKVWRVEEQAAIETVKRALARTELLIADGHHRYETARIYAEEIGGDGDHRYVLMCLVALEDPGLTVFPTHRLLKGLSPEQREALTNTIDHDFDTNELDGAVESPGIAFGYVDGGGRRLMLTLKDPALADNALADHAEPYRRLDTAVLEALILKGALRLSDEDIDHQVGLGYTRDTDEALQLVRCGDYEVAFLMSPIPVAQVQAIAAAGESMPPKSTYFFPKVPTGLVFNPL